MMILSIYVKKILILAITCTVTLSQFIFVEAQTQSSYTNSLVSELTAPYADIAPKIDGINQEPQWELSQWQPMNHVLIGDNLSRIDFSGRYKLMWDEKALYALVEITDDVLFDQEPDPLKAYWDDDCLEVFIDEDASGGDHLFNHNAFAYHIALDGNVVDIAGKNAQGQAKVALFNQHVVNAMRPIKALENTYRWELAISLFNDKYHDTFHENRSEKSNEKIEMKHYHKLSDEYHRETLFEQKEIGFMLAYCDNDGSKHREHFINSTDITPIQGDKNLGYKNASVFQTLRLVKK